MTLSLRDIQAGRYGAPVDAEDVSVPNTTETSKITRPAHKIIRLSTISTEKFRYRVAYNPLKDGDFEALYTTWDKDSNGDYDVEGATLRKNGPWKEKGTTGAVTLNKTSPLVGVRDAKMAHDSAATRLTNTGQWDLDALKSITVGFAYKNSNVGNTMDYSVSYLNAAGVRRWLQAGDAWGAEHWRTAAGSAVLAYIAAIFTSEEAGRYTIGFRPTGAVAETTVIDQAFFAESALSTDAQLTAEDDEHIVFEHEGRISAIGEVAGPEKINIATMK